MVADEVVRARIAALADADYVRRPERGERQRLQREALGLPLLPTTTIGSFPQTKQVRAERARLRKGEISCEQYDEFIRRQIDDVVAKQEQIGLDVLVHGEFERNDMVEYFGQNLNGFLFTKNSLGAVLRHPLRQASDHLGRCEPCPADHRGMELLCPVAHRQADERHAHRPCHHSQLVVAP